MRYKPINFVVLRTSGIPISNLNIFNLNAKILEDIEKNSELDDTTSNNLKEYFFNSREKIKQQINNPQLRDMIRISSDNFKSFIKNIESSNSLLSQHHRKLMLYLQRGTFKCCTAGSYGPVTIGEFEHSCNNIELFKDSNESFFMMEDWALNAILKSQKIKVSEKEYHDIMENYSLLKKFNNLKLNSIVGYIDKYKTEKNSYKRDKIYSDLITNFKDLTNESKKNYESNRKKDYESRSIIYELQKRGFSFQIGKQLKKDFDCLNKIFGIYLGVLINKFLQNLEHTIQKNDNETIKRYIFKNFHDFSEEAIKEIAEKKIRNFSDINYQHKVLPPIFSPDITVLSKDINSINKGDYKLVIGEIHVSATVISNPMYEFERRKLIDCFVSALRSITKKKICFNGYDIKKDKDFTHHLPLSIQNDIIAKANEDCDPESIIYAYRSNKPPKDLNELQNLLFFPLAIGRRLIYNSDREEKSPMWSRDYLPTVIKRLSKILFPEFEEKILLREEFSLKPPKIKFKNEIKLGFIFNIMKKVSTWRKNNSLSNQIFIRYDSNRKPIYIDLRNPYLVYEFLKISQNLEKVWVSNFLPDNDNQWLHVGSDNFCSEFRYMVCPEIDSKTDISVNPLHNFIYLPGYKSRLTEVSLFKKILSENNINVESLNIDYNQDFDIISKNVLNYINSKYDGPVSLIGLSFGCALAFNLANLAGEKISRIFCLNPFYSRSNVLDDLGYKRNFQEICIKDIFNKNVNATLFTALDDKKINPLNSEKIMNLSENINIYKIPGSDHIFSNPVDQKTLSEHVIKLMKKS